MNELSTSTMPKRLAQLGGERWALHFEARRRVNEGEDIIELTIGEPDIPTPPHLIDVAEKAMRDGRTRYTSGRGELQLLEALVKKYSDRSGRTITTDHVLALPGTQAALALCMMALVEKGDGVLVPDPFYTTYEGVVRATGADFIPVPLTAENGFHLTAEQLEKACVLSPHAKVLLLNSPHNPTGAVLNEEEISAIGEICIKYNLWIVSDEVYEQLIYKGQFASPFDNADLAERTIVVSSISKSHAAPGFRSGWCIAPPWFVNQVLSIAETILFGGQPFIADMTAHAIANPDDTAERMSIAYQRRIELVMEQMASCPQLKPLQAEAGMFMLVDVEATGMDGAALAFRLLDHGVGVMPGDVFGEQAKNFIRLSLTVPDEALSEACKRIIQCVNNQIGT